MSQFSSPPTVPPMTEFDDMPAELPKWPKVVGIFSIVWGSFWIVCGGCGLMGMFFMPSMIPPEQAAQMPPMNPGMGAVAAMIAGMGLDVILIVAGVLTIGRNAVGRLLHFVYAIGALPMIAASVYFNMQHQANVEQWYQQNPDTPAAKAMQGGSGNLIQMAGLVFMLVIGLAYPIFVFVWFGVIKRKPGDMGVAPTQEVI